MGRSNRLRLNEIRGVFRLLNEAQELAAEPYAARRHLAFGLCRLVDARQAYYVGFEHFTPAGQPMVRDMVIGGWPDEQMLRHWQQWGTRRMLREDPLVDQTTYLPGPCATRVRRQLASDRQWEGSTAYEAFAGPGGVGDIIVSFYRHRRADRTAGFAIQRHCDQPDYTPSERRLIALFNAECYRLYRQGRFQADEPDEATCPKLAPRQHQILDALLAGGGIKQVASTCRLSRRTAEAHVRVLYTKFGVSSRYALMARFVPAGGALLARDAPAV